MIMIWKAFTLIWGQVATPTDVILFLTCLCSLTSLHRELNGQKEVKSTWCPQGRVCVCSVCVCSVCMCLHCVCLQCVSIVPPSVNAAISLSLALSLSLSVGVKQRDTHSSRGYMQATSTTYYVFIICIYLLGIIYCFIIIDLLFNI